MERYPAELVISIQDFTDCDWKAILDGNKRDGYSSMSQALSLAARQAMDKGQQSQGKVLWLLADACSMMFDVNSINEPFKPISQDFQAGMRSTITDDFSEDDIDFFESILDDVDEPWLKARLADILWLRKKPKNITHAKAAITAYIIHPINARTWRRDIDDCWERAIRLCLQIRETETLEGIENKLLTAFRVDHKESHFMVLWLAQLLDKVGLAKDVHAEVAQRLYSIAENLNNQGKYDNARSYFELSVKKYSQDGDEQGKLNGLVKIAESFEAEGDQRASSETPSQMVANTFYEKTIQAYRSIPVKHRDTYDVQTKIRALRDKLVNSGQASLGEMTLIKTPTVDIKEIAKASQAHVAGKESVEQVLMYFTGLDGGPEYETLKESAINNISENPLSSIFGTTHMAADGRVVARTPSMSFSQEDTPENEAVLHKQILQQFSIDTQFVIQARILPALHQILKEHRIKLELLESLCHHSPIVPPHREKLTAMALWLGFEYDFENAIHLLSPQFENIIRVKLKEAGAHTTFVDPNGIESENGLSSLLDLPEAVEVFGQDTVFEMKAIFTDSIGPNLRNEVAHGLLDDRSSSSVGSIYAWWMILRLIVRSLIGISASSVNEAENKETEDVVSE